MSDLDIQRQIRDLEYRLERLEKVDLGPVYGTYVPTYDGATPGSTTYSVQVGFWVRMGPVIFFTATIVWTAASGTGDARISLPFTAENVTNEAWATYVRSINVTFANGSIQGQISANTNFMFMLSPATNAAGTNVQVEAAGNLIVTGFFITA